MVISSSELNIYEKLFANLRTAKRLGISAPHKPILLLSIIQSFEEKEIDENKIYITPQLVARFRDNWCLLVKNKQFTCNFSLPFYHLKSEGFWFLKTFPSKEIALTSSHSIKSFSQLKDSVDFSYLDLSLFILLMDAKTRHILRNILLEKYFPGFIIKALNPYSMMGEISDQILNDPPTVYQLEVRSADEEEIFVRSGVFKKVVPEIYDYTCCITGMRIEATANIQMIDACHIKPFSVSYDDTISNGISLCPNLHRAFDRGLISLDADYKVLVSDIFSETDGEYSIKHYQGKQILLPLIQKQLPSILNIEWHRKNIFRVA